MKLRFMNRLQRLLPVCQTNHRRSKAAARRRRAFIREPERLEPRALLSVTTTYQMNFVQNADVDNVTAQPGATSLATGGFAVLGTHSTHTDLDIFNGDLTEVGGAGNVTGTNSAIAQLSNGNLVIVGQDADSILFRIHDSTGNLVLGSTDISDVNSSESDVAAANGSFWVVNQDTNGTTNWDIDVRRYSNAGVLLGGDTIGSSSAGQDARPRVAVLDNGNVAVAWQRNEFLGNEMWLAVFSSTGGTVKAPTLIDAVGISNRDVDITSTPAGFAIVYVDSGWDTNTEDITMKRFSSTGTLLGTTNISDLSSGADDFGHEAKPTVTRLANNLLVAGWEDNRQTAPGSNLTDTFVYLIDPSTGTRLSPGRNVSAGQPETDDVEQITIAGSANGRINVFHRNVTDNDIDGETLVGQRTSTSNIPGDTITGDAFIDIMHGNGGSDTLLGGGNNDILNGDNGDDTLNGGTGDDILNGGNHDDTLVGRSGADSLDGGSGIDTANYTANSSCSRAWTR